MPPEMLRIESGSGLNSAAIYPSIFPFAFPGTFDTTVEDMKVEGEDPRKVFPLALSLEKNRPSQRGVSDSLVTNVPSASSIETQEQEHFTVLIWNSRLGHYNLLSSSWTVRQERLHQGSIQFGVLQGQPVSSQEEKFAQEVTEVTSLFPTTIETLSPEAAERFRGHERIVQEVCSLAKEEAQARRLTLLCIDVRPAWSHEYDERRGIVIDVEIKASSDERFSYWDAVCERLSQLEDSLPQEEQQFLNDQVFFVVNRS